MGNQRVIVFSTVALFAALGVAVGCCSSCNRSPGGLSGDDGDIEVLDAVPEPEPAPGGLMPYGGRPVAGTVPVADRFPVAHAADDTPEPAPEPEPEPEPTPVPQPEPQPTPEPEPTPAPQPTPPQPTPAQPTPAPPTQPQPPARPALPPLAPIERSRFEKLKVRGTKGGRLAWIVDGDVALVSGLLMDYDNANGNRAWGRSYRTISRSPNRVVAEWNFKGKAGISPTVHIEFTRMQQGPEVIIRYRVVKGAFGIKKFFGEYRVAPVQGQPGRSVILESVFIDSGIPFTGASHEDMEKGLRRDATLIRAWAAQQAGHR